MDTEEKKDTYVRVEKDGMTAYLFLAVPESGHEYTLFELVMILNANMVSMGIDEEAIQYMVDHKVYMREVVVARGKEPTDGIDGVYEYKFNKTLDKKPRLLEDGSVDYWSINSIENVYKGQVIAVYKPPVNGENGYDVRGKTKLAKRGKDLSPLKGKGFSRESDKITYVSKLDGKIEVYKDKINISEIYEIFGNADLSVGNIDFPGDVVIHGIVCSGVKINAGGSLTVDGNVEAAFIHAKKDIIFRSGMQGGYKATLRSDGDIYAKFIENTIIESGGIIQADVILNCIVKKCEKLILSGERSTILGGEVHAIQGIDTMMLGNESQIQTEIVVGIPPEIYQRKRLLEKKIDLNVEHIRKIEEGLETLDKMIEKDKSLDRNDPRRTQLLRAKIKDSVVLETDRDELGKLADMIERGKHATVKVGGNVYPAVKIHIDELKIVTKEKFTAVEFVRRGDNIIMNSLAVNINRSN